jgi:excisionase family DNA binding protein
MNMAEAIEMLKTTRATFYRWLRDGKIKGMKVGRQWRFYREDLEHFLKGEAPRVDLPTSIDPLIQQLKEKLGEMDADLREEDGETDQVTFAVKLMIRLAYYSKASKLHLQVGEREGLIRMRIDGRLHEVLRIDRRLVAPLVERWKSLAGCDLNVKNLPQDGRLIQEMDVPIKQGLSSQVDVRVCFVPSLSGECLTASLLDNTHASIQLEQIDFSPEDRAKLDAALAKKRGLVVVTGPADCGKTSTLYACMNALRKPENMLMTVEDPVAFTLPDVVQIRVRHQHGLTFTHALRAMLRSDPDVIMVGEIRDRDTLEISLQGVLNGHLMMTVLHTEDSVSGLSRLSSICEHPVVLADTVGLILAQRLVRLVCPHCSEPSPPEEGNLQIARKVAERSGIDWKALEKNFIRGKGCTHCSGMGFRGRTVITETLEMTPKLQAAQREGADEEKLRQLALYEGMIPMAVDGILKAAAGKTTLGEVARVMGGLK